MLYKSTAPIQFGSVTTESKADDAKQAVPETLPVADNASTVSSA